MSATKYYSEGSENDMYNNCTLGDNCKEVKCVQVVGPTVNCLSGTGGTTSLAPGCSITTAPCPTGKLNSLSTALNTNTNGNGVLGLQGITTSVNSNNLTFDSVTQAGCVFTNATTNEKQFYPVNANLSGMDSLKSAGTIGDVTQCLNKWNIAYNSHSRATGPSSATNNTSIANDIAISKSPGAYEADAARYRADLESHNWGTAADPEYKRSRFTPGYKLNVNRSSTAS